jgi:asparagine synthase (glutamine-hydrolysing)
MMRKLFEDLLPVEILTRRSKARFDQVLWGPRTRTFARDWDGAGVDPTLVNHERLRAAWRAEKPLYGSWTVLQAAWLHSHDAGARA